jgi:hypothetical protein
VEERGAEDGECFWVKKIRIAITKSRLTETQTERAQVKLSLVVLAAAAGVLASCRKDANGDVVVKTPVVETRTDTVKTPTVEVTKDTLTTVTPKVEVKKETTSVTVPHVKVKSKP